ncbi:MAG: helix-turn-helix transcriptional regulator [Alphaproteobacteria bacterium]|nr:helix-turn-helix transcriptional regulator [Alphaproteobacteria bacterium]NCQ67037.1 helix-turn-helix transcriptional regulator [Alphaproteobacteria bacterium]NCT07634.1 helix-turn-helix transcriptional regulator [Alphaproteobacteria bacterium]
MQTQITNIRTLGALIKEARKSQTLTQEDLAGITLTGRRFIVDLENGKETAEIGKVLQVLNALGIALTASATWKD